MADPSPTPLWVRLLPGLLLILQLLGAAPALAAPGICVGPFCAEVLERSSIYPWQLRLRLSDARGQQERLTVDCRVGQLSPAEGPIDRRYAEVLARRACRLA